MSNKQRTWTRNGRDNHDDVVTRSARFASAEGRDTRRSTPSYRASEQLDGSDLVAAMKKVFAGVPGEYHICDAVFSLQHLEGGPVLRFQDAKTSAPIKSARPGHYVPMWLLEKTFRNGGVGEKESLDNQLVLGTLLAQPEAIQAWEEHSMEAKQNEVQQKLDALKRLGKMHREVPKLNHVAEILTATRGEIDLYGVVVRLGFGRSKRDDLPPVIITIEAAPEGHAMVEMLGDDGHPPVHVKQSDMSRSDEVDPGAPELFQKSSRLRLWLRKQLEAAGIDLSTLKSPVRKTDDSVKAPKLTSVSQLTNSWGTYEASDGLVFYAGYLGFGPKPKTMVIRVSDAPEGHPMKVMAEKNIFAFQTEIRFAADKVLDDGTVVAITEKSELAKELRAYLRVMLHAAGYAFKARQQAVAQTATDDAHDAVAEANERAMRSAIHGPNPVAQSAPDDLVAEAARVEAELAPSAGKAAA